jgi:hypothetical protein
VGVFTALLTIGAYYINLSAFLAFALLVVVYLLAAIVHITEPGSNTLLNITGWIGIRRQPVCLVARDSSGAARDGTPRDLPARAIALRPALTPTKDERCPRLHLP